MELICLNLESTSNPLFLTSNSMSYFWDSHMYMRSKYSLQICFSWSKMLVKRIKRQKENYTWRFYLSIETKLKRGLTISCTWKYFTSSNRILIPLSRSHLSPSSLKTFAWYSLQIATRSSVKNLLLKIQLLQATEMKL